MEITSADSLVTLLGIVIFFLIAGGAVFWIWSTNHQKKTLKSIDQTFSRLLGEEDAEEPTESEPAVESPPNKSLRPWVCIHCGTANPAVENYCQTCGKESIS